MTKKIFRSIMLVAMAALLAGLAVVTAFLYEYFGGVEKQRLRDELDLAAVSVEANGAASFWPIRRPTRKRWKTTPGARKCDRRLKPERARAAAIPPR